MQTQWAKSNFQLTSSGNSTTWNWSHVSGDKRLRRTNIEALENRILPNNGLFSRRLSMNGCPLKLRKFFKEMSRK